MRIAETNDELVDLIAAGSGTLGEGLRAPRVLDAMRAVDRARFLPAAERWAAYLDRPVDIGSGQTCSQPSLVAFMLGLLDIGLGDRVLEIGAGCGYAAAIAARLCAPDGPVCAAELLAELADAGRANCAVFSDRIEYFRADASAGLPERAPYDRILVSAGARAGFRAEPLLAELAADGVLVYPEARGSLYRLRRGQAGFVREAWGGVAFVPLLGRNS